MMSRLIDPSIAFLLRKLGDLLQRRGLEDFALHCYAQARSLDPDAAAALYAEARACWNAGDHGAARALLQGLLNLDPGHARGRNLLGAIHFAAEDFAAAEVLFRQAIDLAPGLSAAHNNLGNIFVEREDFTAAEPHYHAALACEPEYVEALSNLAMIVNRQGRHEEAETLCRRALQLRPQFAGALNNLANILLDQGRRGEAIDCYRAALRHQPDLPEAHLNLAVALEDPDQLLGSLDHYRKVLERKPDSYIAHLRIGTALQVMGDWAGSERHLEVAEGLRPPAMEVPHLRGNNANLMGDYQRADRLYRRALLLGAGSPTHSSYLFNQLYDPECGPLDFLREARDWAILYAESSAPIPARHASDRTGRRLRIGYLSKDFARHSVAYFIEPVIAHHDRDRFEIFCYSNNPKPDAVTERFEKLAEHWRDIAFVSDEEAFRQITADGIDILVDLSGHTGGNRRHLLARRPAPVQVNYLGYPATMAMSAIGYRIVDTITDPPGAADAAHTEALVRLPGCFLTYLPAQDPPDIAPPPSAVRGHITFGSFNNPVKINRDVVAVWAKILHSVPRSRLLLKGLGFATEAACERFREMFAACGIAAERLDLIAWHPEVKGHLELYGQIDIALDPFPYNGTTTTCEALWMGVPVVTLAGDRHSARVGASLLAAVGLSEFVGSSSDDYVACAARLAADPARLAALREGLRTQMQSSPLLDAGGFTRNLEAAYETIWQSWLDRQAADVAGRAETMTAELCTLSLSDSVRICLPDSLEVMTRYVVEEQGDWFEQEGPFVRALVGPGMKVVDIGANFGVYALALGHRVGAAGHVWAFEPGPAVAAALRRSCAENGFAQVEVVEAAVAEHTGRARLLDRGGAELQQIIFDDEASETKVPIARRLHIGGQIKSDGWEVLNAVSAPYVDHVCNGNNLSQFANNTFKEIYASHIVEHLDYVDELAQTLREWNRVLQPGGRLLVSVPDLDVLAKLILSKEDLTGDERFYVMRMIFGGHIDKYDYHVVGLNEEFLARFLKEAGFVNIRRTNEFGLFRDMSSTIFKGVAISLNMIAEKPRTPIIVTGDASMPPVGAGQVAVTHLDEWAGAEGWPSIDFIKIDAEGQEVGIVRGAQGFLTTQSPLVMAEYLNGAERNDEMILAFAALGYAAWRLMPGLQLLVPVAPNDGTLADAPPLNLFFCKPDRAEALAAADRLVLASAQTEVEATTAGSSALAGLFALPYARPWVEAWREWLEPEGVAARESGARSYRAALEHYALSRDAALTRATRWRHLGTAMDILDGLGGADAPLSQRLTHARLLYDAGLGPRADDLLAAVIPRLLEGEPELTEPFVLPCARYERVAPPAGAVSDWLLAACFEQREIVNGLTGYLDPAASLHRLRHIRDLGYGDAHIAHRAALIVRRFDQRRVRFC